MPNQRDAVIRSVVHDSFAMAIPSNFGGANDNVSQVLISNVPDE